MLDSDATQIHDQEILFNTLQQLNIEDLHIKQCPKTKLIAIIAIHSTALGPALGGVRCVPYATLNDAIIDAMYLARGMSFKAAISGLPQGGGKAVIMKPPHIEDRHAFFNAFGQFIDELGGRYITAEDSGVNIADMNAIKEKTPYVTGHSDHDYQIHDPSPLTALGVRRGMEAAIHFKLKKNSLHGVHVAIKGVGKVGSFLCQELHELGAQLTIADINEQAVEKVLQTIPAKVASIDTIHKTVCDIYAPCALSFTLTEKIISEIKAPIIAGAANNQLSSPNCGYLLQKLGILYAPDFAINAGGLIHVSAQYTKNPEKEARHKVNQIYQTMLDIFESSHQKGMPPHEIAENMAKEKLNTLSN